eukprot:s1_g2086.t1
MIDMIILTLAIALGTVAAVGPYVLNRWKRSQEWRQHYAERFFEHAQKVIDHEDTTSDLVILMDDFAELISNQRLMNSVAAMWFRGRFERNEEEVEKSKWLEGAPSDLKRLVRRAVLCSVIAATYNNTLLGWLMRHDLQRKLGIPDGDNPPTQVRKEGDLFANSVIVKLGPKFRHNDHHGLAA